MNLIYINNLELKIGIENFLFRCSILRVLCASVFDYFHV